MFNQPSESWFVATHNAFIDSIDPERTLATVYCSARESPASTGSPTGMWGTLGEAQASLSKARPIWSSRFRREDTICDTSAIVAFDWPLGEGNDGLNDGLAGRRLDHELTADPP